MILRVFLGLLLVLWLSPAQSQEARCSLSNGQAIEADAARCEQLEGLLAGMQTSAEPVDANAIGSVIAEHYEASDGPRRSLWQRFLAWLNTWFDDGEGKSEFNLLEWWLKVAPSEANAQLMFNVLAGLLVLLALALALREMGYLRGAGRNRMARGPGITGLDAGPESIEVWPPDLRGLDPRASLARCFASLCAHLRERQRIPGAPGLTNRELAGLLAEQDPPCANDIRWLQAHADAAVYGGIDFETQAVTEALRRAHAVAASDHGDAQANRADP
jgi:hypothetical protein